MATWGELLVTLSNTFKTVGALDDAKRAEKLFDLLTNHEMPPDYCICQFPHTISFPCNIKMRVRLNTLFDEIMASDIDKNRFVRETIDFSRQRYPCVRLLGRPIF